MSQWPRQPCLLGRSGEGATLVAFPDREFYTLEFDSVDGDIHPDIPFDQSSGNRHLDGGGQGLAQRQ